MERQTRHAQKFRQKKITQIFRRHSLVTECDEAGQTLVRSAQVFTMGLTEFVGAGEGFEFPEISEKKGKTEK